MSNSLLLSYRAVLERIFIPTDRYGRPKKMSLKNKKLNLLKLTYLFLKKRFHENLQNFKIDNPSTANAERGFSAVSTFLSIKVRTNAINIISVK